MNLIEAVQQNNQTEFFRILDKKTDFFGKKIVDKVDAYGKSALHWAAFYGHIHFISLLIKAGADVNKRDEIGETPTYEAAYNGHAEAITALKAAGANVDTPTKPHMGGGETPVFIAAREGHAAAITALKAAGANVDTPAPNGATPVFVAAKNGYAEVIRSLKAAGANVDTPNRDGMTPVFAAAMNGHAEIIVALKAVGVNVDTPHKNGCTPVWVAAANGKAAAIAALKAAGANVNTPSKDGMTPVFCASIYGHAYAIVALHAAGANVDTPYKGMTPVFAAAMNGHAEIIVALHAAGANVDTPFDGITPVCIAAVNGKAAAIAALKAAGADVNTPAMHDITPIFFAAQGGHVDVIHALHAAGANVDTPSKDGMTPVFFAAEDGHAAAITALHSLGANVDTPCKDGRTPMCISAYYGRTEAVTALLEAGANASIKTEFGTALEIAKNSKAPEHKKVVKLLESHFKQYPNGVKPVVFMNKTEVSLSHRNGTKNTHILSTEAERLSQPNLSVLQDAPASQLLKSLQSQLMTGEKQSSSFTLSHILTGIKITLGTLVHDLQETEKEKQALEKIPYEELERHSQYLQETLQKELSLQETQYTLLKEQKEDLQKKISDLEKSLTKTFGVEQQKIQTNLEALQEQFLIVKAHQDILWNEHEVKAQKREALKRFQSHPNLLLFYRTVHIKLEEIFISFKAVAGGFVNPVDGNVAIAKSIFDAIGDAASIAPLLGTAVEKILKWSVSKGLGKIDSARQKNTAINGSGLVTLSEVKKYAESIARQLTERYADQLQLLATPEEEQAETYQLKKGLNKIKESLLKEQCTPSAKKLAAFGVLWIIDQLDDAANIDESKGLDEALLLMISQKKPADKLKEFWQVITTKLGIKGIRSKNGDIWHPEAVYTLPGIRTVKNEYYSSEILQPEKYGWRLGTIQEAESLNLKQCTAPTTQTHVLENQKFVQSISIVNNAVKEMKQETEQHGARLEKMEKTGHIVEGARLRALQEELAKEREERAKDKEDMKKRLERLEAFLLANPQQPSSPIISSEPLILRQTEKTANKPENTGAVRAKAEFKVD